MSNTAVHPFVAEEVRRLTRSVKQTRLLLTLALRLAWDASPVMVVGITVLPLAQAALSPLQLLMTRSVIDRASFDLGLSARLEPWSASLPLGSWIVATAVVLGVAQLVRPFSAAFQALAGARLTVHVSERLIRAANSWPGLARFEDARFANDLHRARRQAAGGGLSILVNSIRVLEALLAVVGLLLVSAGLHPLVPLVIVAATLPHMAW